MNRFSVNDIGKKRRLSNIFKGEEKCLIVPLDDNLISGTDTKIENMQKKVEQIEKAKPSAILAYPGTLSLVNNYEIATILNLTASTINACHNNKVLVSSVLNAVKLGADAVAVHVNLTSKYESCMLKILGSVSEECNSYGVPLVAIIYPRGETNSAHGEKEENYLKMKCDNPQKYTQLVSHCARVAFEMGADLIKTQYTGSCDSFKSVVESANGIPVVIAGGSVVDISCLFDMIESAVKAGASGISIGRNIFSREDSDKIIICIHKLLFEGLSSKEVLEIYKRESRKLDEYMG